MARDGSYPLRIRQVVDWSTTTVTVILMGVSSTHEVLKGLDDVLLEVPDGGPLASYELCGSDIFL